MFEQLFQIPGLNIYMQIVVTLAVIGLELLRTRGKPEGGRLTLVVTLTIGMAGWFTITNALLGHIFFADTVAESIGWATGSGFQTELALALIGIGLVGALGFWRQDFWLPFIIAKSTMSIGAGFTHIADIVQHANFAPGNAGPILYWDFIQPLILIGLYLLYIRSQKDSSTRSQAAALS